LDKQGIMALDDVHCTCVKTKRIKMASEAEDIKAKLEK